MKCKIILLASFMLFSCATGRQGMLAGYEGLAPLDMAQLDRQCDLGDDAACHMAGKELTGQVGTLPVMQGTAPPNQAIFNVLLQEGQTAKWFLFSRESNTLKPVPVARVSTRPGSRFRLEQLELKDLDPHGKYELIAADAFGRFLDFRRFRPLQFETVPFRFALVSCADDRFAGEQAGMWNSLTEKKPDLILAIGDNTYADWRGGKRLADFVNPATLWERYSETRQLLAIFRHRDLIPFFATWDDHDFGMNDGDLTYPYGEESRKVMEAFFPTKADAKLIQEGPGVSKSLRAGGQTFVLFDDRSFRSPNGIPILCRHSKHALCKDRKAPPVRYESTHFGRLQEDWALRQLEEETGPVWLISGDQWFGGYHPFESYEGNHNKSFHRFLSNIWSSLKKRHGRAPALIFASGDRHLSEIIQVKPFARSRYQTYEFTSSGIHAYMFPDAWKDFPNPRQVAGDSGRFNFTVFETASGEKGGLSIRAISFGPGDAVLYEKSLEVEPVSARRGR